MKPDERHAASCDCNLKAKAKLVECHCEVHFYLAHILKTAYHSAMHTVHCEVHFYLMYVAMAYDT